MKLSKSGAPSFLRRKLLAILSLSILGCSKEPIATQRVKPIFNVGTCLAIALRCGGYGAAIVLQIDADSDDARHLIGGLAGVFEEPPPLDVFEQRNWLHLTHGNFNGKQHLIWCESSTYAEDAKDAKYFRHSVIGTTDLRSSDPHAPNGILGPGLNSVYEVGISSWGWIGQQIAMQHEHELNQK